MNTVKTYARQRRLAAVMMQQLRRQEHMMGIAADVYKRQLLYPIPAICQAPPFPEI